MGGPARPRKGLGSPSKPTVSIKKSVTYESPEWLVNMAVENSKKANMPLDFLATKLNELATSGDASPYRAKKRKSVDEVGDPMAQEREMKKPARIESQKANTISVGQSHEKVEVGPMAESSTAGAARNRGLLTDLTGYESSPTSAGEPPGSLFVPEIKGPEYLVVPPPSWYMKIKATDRGMKQLGKHPSSDQTQALKALQSMKGCIERCEKENVTRVQLAKLFEELRDQVHKAEILLKVDRFVIRKAKMLDEATGLPRIFASKKVDYPWDLQADAYQLYSRWCEEIFEIDLLRGIKARQGKDRHADSIDPSWKGRFSAKFYGEGHLILGQWWPTQLATVRDGAHGSAQGGIFGEKGKGTYSVVLSGAGNIQYNDEDNGDDIWYSGTDGKDFTPTENTLRLIESCDTLHNKVRVLRSHQLPKNNPYRPVVGLRYDGLYEIVDKRLVDPEKQSYKFRLVRCKGQFPIRCEDNAARRPTRFEIAEDGRLRHNGR